MATKLFLNTITIAFYIIWLFYDIESTDTTMTLVFCAGLPFVFLIEMKDGNIHGQCT